MKLNNNIVEEILTGFVKSETSRIGITKAVLGLSGGIDSAVAAYLTAKALGPENVWCIMMPYKLSSKESLTHAELVVNALGVNSAVIPVTDMADAYFKTIKEDVNNLRAGNVFARCRMIILYDQSAKHNALVIGTGNKTEILLGYTTIYGDSASALNPVGDLYKTQLRELAAHLGVPKEILEKKPSADLWKGQTDEGELGFTYAEVDKYLFCKVDERKTTEELIKQGYSEEFMKKVDTMIMRNQFKRLPPLIAKLQNRTINVDFRYNRDWGT